MDTAMASSETEHADYQIWRNGAAWSSVRRGSLESEIERVQGIIDREREIYGKYDGAHRALCSFVEHEIMGWNDDNKSAVVVKPITTRIQRCIYDRANRRYTYETMATWVRGERQ